MVALYLQPQGFEFVPSTDAACLQPYRVLEVRSCMLMSNPEAALYCVTGAGWHLDVKAASLRSSLALTQQLHGRPHCSLCQICGRSSELAMVFAHRDRSGAA